jgi:hypothetical protein
MCTKTFQFLTAEFIVEIMQDVDSIIAGVHSESRSGTDSEDFTV